MQSSSAWLSAKKAAISLRTTRRTTLAATVRAPPNAALAIDMTARNLQDKVKKQGLPWSAAKGFDTFTPVRYVV